MNQFDKFYSYLEDLEQSYGRLSDLLRQKMVAVDQYDIGKLDEIIKEEQVYVLLSKGFDGNIASFREKLSLSGDTLSSCIDEMPGEEQERFHRQFRRLESTLAEVKGLNEKCQSLIEERLYSIEKSIKEMDKSEGTTYQKGGSSGSGPEQKPRIFTKSI